MFYFVVFRIDNSLKIYVITIMFRYLNSGQNQNIRIANESFENVAKFKSLGKKLTNQNEIRED
jgi:hypothetical protein